jgi:hypothetical protein
MHTGQRDYNGECLVTWHILLYGLLYDVGHLIDRLVKVIYMYP